MYIIDETYFTDKIRITNISQIDVGGSNESFERWIDRESRLCLQEALGSVLFADFDSNVTDGVYIPGVAKWDRLVNGHTYTKNSKTFIWKGLVYEEGIYKGSLLALFVYCKWLEFQLSHQSGIGEVRGNAANSMSVNSTHRYVSLWNEFLEQYQGDLRTTHTHYSPTYYKGVEFYDYFGDDKDTFVSMLTFLSDNEDDYPDPQAKEYYYVNTFGI
jgi:hypothetical protein